jgi:hypothetical protein
VTIFSSIIQERRIDVRQECKAKTRKALVRCQEQKSTIEPIMIHVQQSASSPTYETIEHDLSIDRVSMATVAVNASAMHIGPSLDTVHTTPKPSTFKRIQSLFRASPGKNIDEL